MSQGEGKRKLKLARRREDDIIVKKLVYVEVSGGLATFESAYELNEYMSSLDVDMVERLLELYAEAMPSELCDAIKRVKDILREKIEVQVPEVCLESLGGQTQQG
jgi:hypothetical protein